MPPELITWLIPLPPLIAFALIVLFINPSKVLSHLVAIGAMATSFGLSLWVLFGHALAVGGEELGHHPIASSLPWLPTGDTALATGVLVDPLAAVMLIFVPLTCLMIFIYSVGYHNFGQPVGDHDVPGLPPHGTVEPMYSRFFAFISLFAFAMLTLVVADNLLLLFIGWELMGLCSYLLIGFWYGKDSAKRAAVKAFMTTRVGDVIMMLGIVYLYSQTGTLSFREVLYNEEILEQLAHTPSLIVGLSASNLIGLLLFAGAVGKSSQFPLHVWLPDAMEGPTPVSAMIHAATMVSAGVYMVIRMFPIMSAGWEHGQPLTPAMWAMALVGAFTALFASTIAVAQNDVKRVLAYSTISQLGYMVAALGIGAYVAAVFHLVTHAFFKALLFLASGSVIHGVEHGDHEVHEHLHDNNDMMNYGGLRTRMPVTFWTFLLGGLALSGFPLITAGFWSKDEILADAFATGQVVVFAVLAFSALLTAFYTARQISLTFLGEPRTKSAGHAPENVWTMTLPLVVLAVFAVTAGWAGIPDNFLGLNLGRINWLHPFVGATLVHHPETVPFSIAPLLTSVIVALGGLFLGWWVYGRKPLAAGQPDPLSIWLGPIFTLLQRKYYMDELYDYVFVRPAQWLAEQFAYLFVDKTLIDGVLHGIGNFAVWLGGAFRNYFDNPVVNGFGDLVGESVKAFGRSFRIIQTGRVQNYLLVVLWAVLAFSALFYVVAR
jgi:NADH-quinone oxidoreductase subunit L